MRKYSILVSPKMSGNLLSFLFSYSPSFISEGKREREKERKREGEKERKREREKERRREGEKERNREREKRERTMHFN